MRARSTTSTAIVPAAPSTIPTPPAMATIRSMIDHTGRLQAPGPGQGSGRPVDDEAGTGPKPDPRCRSVLKDYLRTFVTVPAPTVRPPSRMAKPRPSSMAIGWISSTVMSVVSPGMTISVPSGSVMTPVTSVVRK